MSGHAVVVGGGIGGLLAAHALADRFERVTILERDRYPSASHAPVPPARRGVPQSRCLHLLMAGGAAAFDELAPGWRERLVERGAVPFDASADAVLRFAAGWLPRTVSGITTYASSRALLEDVLRRGLDGQVKVSVREGQKVLGLLGSSDGDRVTGVRTSDAEGSGEAMLAADLVVDSSGRNSLLPLWLDGVRSGLGGHVQETVVEPRTQYVSRWVQLEPTDAPDWHCLSIAPAEGFPRAAMMMRAENHCWGVVLLAPAGDPLPFADDAFLDFTATLADGALRQVLARAKPVSAIHHYGVALNRLRHYDRLSWPAGLVALGDAVCALDPYFGLGMAATARGVVLLRNHLKGGADLSASCVGFQRALAALNAQPWHLATGCDTNGRPLAVDEGHLGRLHEAAPTRPDIARALLAVQHLLRPVESLMELQTA